MAQGGRPEESRGIAASQHIAQASRLCGGGEALTGPARFTWQSWPSRGGVAGMAQAGMAQAGMAQAGMAQAATRWARANVAHLGWRRVADESA